MNKTLIKTLFSMKLDLIDRFIESLPRPLSTTIKQSKTDIIDIIKTTIEENQNTGKITNPKTGLNKINIE